VNCPEGGTRVEFGYDLNLDGTLGNAEGQGVYYVCAGSSGADGTNGVNGTPGTDGTNGTPGTNGADGDEFGVVVRVTEAGFPCAAGGIGVRVGHDSGAGGGIANDGILQDGEVDSRSQRIEGCALDCVGINVTSTADAGPGTLRQAIADSNASGGADTICVPSGNYLLTSGRLLVTDEMRLEGERARGVVIDGNDAGGVFEIAAGASGIFDNITVTGANTAAFTGGGFHVDGSLILTECTVTGNTASFGAGIRLTSADASALVQRSTFSNNVGFGSAIESQGGSITIENSTFTGNTGGGGVVRLSNAGLLSLRSSTVFLNDSGLSAGGGSASLRVGGSIIAGVTGPEIDGTVDDEGGNFIGGDPDLGPLANNGGPTDTLLPNAGSGVIDTGSNPTAADIDQRGFAREVGTAPDCGSVEVAADAP
jgi:hypothetical protein